MAHLSSLCVCVCAVLLCLVFLNNVDALGKWKIKGGASFRPKTPKFRTHSNPGRIHTHTHISSSAGKTNLGTLRHMNTAPIGFEHLHRPEFKPQTNSAPIGFEHLQNPVRKSQAPIGLESFNKNTHISSGPPMPVPHHNIPHSPSAPAMSVPHQGNPYTPSAPLLPVPHQHSPYTPSAPAMPAAHQNNPYAPSAPAMPVPHQNSPYTPSVPVMPGFHQNIPSAPVMPIAHTGFNQPISGSSFPSNQYPGKLNNPYQTNSNMVWDSHSNAQFKPSYNFPNTGYPNANYPHSGYPNFGYSNTGYPNSGYPYNPSQPFVHSYYGNNPNFGYPSYPNNYFGNSYYRVPNSVGNFYPVNSYNAHGSNYYPGAGYGYPGQFSYNDYKPKSKFGFGGWPIPIPIPIPIPLGGFGSWGLGGNRNDDYSHRILNTLQNTTSLNNTSNATSIYVVNNVTVVSCTNELFMYGLVNITLTTCTADNCTSVKVYMANNSTVNHWTLTMCMDPNVTVTTNSSNAIKPEVTGISRYWQRVCVVLPSKPSNGTAKNTTTTTTMQNVTTPIMLTKLVDTNVTAVNVTSTASVKTQNINRVANYTVNTTLVNPVNSTGNANITNMMCEILHCSYVSMCLPETEVDNSTRTSYRPCVRVKMCKSPKMPITRHVTLNTTAIRHDGVSRTESYSSNNITVLAFHRIRNNYSTNSTVNMTSLVVPIKPPTNTTGFAQLSGNPAMCPGVYGGSLCNTTSVGNVTSTSNTTSTDNLELDELKQRNDRLQQLDTELKNRKS